MRAPENGDHEKGSIGKRFQVICRNYNEGNLSFIRHLIHRFHQLSHADVSWLYKVPQNSIL